MPFHIQAEWDSRNDVYNSNSVDNGGGVAVCCLLYSGNLLSDSALLSSLNKTKAKALTVAAALEDGKQLVTELDQQRSVYRPLAARGSALYFSLLHLRRLDNMYCFSLPVRFLALWSSRLSEQTRPVC